MEVSNEKMGDIDLIIKRDEEDADAAEVLADAWIGKNKYRFILDTGAAGSAVESDSYTGTFVSGEKHSSSGVFARSSNDVIQVPYIRLGPIVRENIAIVRYGEDSGDTRNLIGMDILKDYRLYFSFERSMVTVNPAGEPEGMTLQELELGRRYHPYVHICFEGIRAKAVWDTGAGITIVDTAFVERHPELFTEAGQSAGTDSTGTKSETPTYIMADTKIGGQYFAAHKVAAVDLSHVNSTTEIPMDMILGYTTLSKADWYFDFPGKKWGALGLREK